MCSGGGKEQSMKSKLICSDNSETSKSMEDQSVDLIYIGPAFFSSKQYEVIWGDKSEIRSFKDRWEGE